MMMYRGGRGISTLLIKNARIVDGSGGAPFFGDILVEDGRIAAVGKEIKQEGLPVLGAAGLIAAPGFIDAHTHNELVIMKDRQQSRALTQGVTTEIVAQCGIGCATPPRSCCRS